jgi:hypothetical protein
MPPIQSICGPSSRLYVQPGAAPETFDYYVGLASTHGASDSNPGTLAQPWTLKALDTKGVTYAGKRIGVLDGAYDVPSIMGAGPAVGNSDVTSNWIRLKGGPSNAQRTIVKAVNLLGAIIDANRDSITAHVAGTMGPAPGEQNITIDGLKFIRANYKAVGYFTSGNFTVQNSWFDDNQYNRLVTGNNSAALLGYQADNVLISNCLFTNGGSTADSGRWSAIQLLNNGTSGTTNSVFEFLTIINPSSAATGANTNGFHCKNPGHRNNKLQYSYIEANAGNPILWHGNSQNTTGIEEMHHCSIVAKAGGELGMLAGEDGAAPLTKRKIWNCTFDASAGSSSGAFLRDFVSTAGFDWWNNVCIRNTVGFRGDLTFKDTSSPGLVDFNFWGDNSPELKTTVGSGASANTSTNAAWQAQGHDTHSVFGGSPSFIASGTRADYYKLNGGGAVGAGRSDGTTGGTACDMGCWGNLPGGFNQIGCALGV